VARPLGPRTVALLAAEGTLAGIEPALARAGVRTLRIPILRPRLLPRSSWQSRLVRFPDVDTVVATSRVGVAAGVSVWRSSRRARGSRVEYWAVGPATARALRSTGARPVRRARHEGGVALARALDREPPRRILYFRSDRAGPGFARFLRRRGHHVADVVVYRLDSGSRVSARVRVVLQNANVWIATSPSALTVLRQAVGASAFSALRRSTRLVVLGEKSRAAAVAVGFGRVSVAPGTTTQRFTRHLLSVLRDAGP
jgi:uroporphyrinogen-III synthase